MSSPLTPRQPIVLMVVQPQERNAPDQRTVEYELFARGVTLLRGTLDEVKEHARYDAQGRMFFHDCMVGLVYYRSCYTPRDLPTQADVDTVAAIECSLAVKCPSVGHHLAGTKKIQQVLTDRSVVRRFLDSDEEADAVMRVFMKMYTLDNDATIDALLTETLAHPEKYVLKPQREGGGNNIWGADIYKTLSAACCCTRRGVYVLMERICPQPFEQAMVKEGTVNVLPTLTELGVFGALLSDGGSRGAQAAADYSDASLGQDAAHGVLRNVYMGQLLRTKPVGVDEGGVATGYSVVDTFILMD